MRFVNKAILSVIAAGTAIAVPTTANAFDYGDSITTSVHKVKFERAALKTPEGVAAVYAKLEKRAKRACAGASNVDAEGNRVSEDVCTADLLTQFVESADLKPLKQYHLMKGASVKSVSFMPR